MTAYRPRPSIVPEGMYAGDYLEFVLMPYWVDAGASSTAKRFLVALWSFHSSGSTYAPLSRLAARMGGTKRLAVQAQAEVVERGLVVVTKEVDRKVERTVRTIAPPVDNPPASVDNPVDNPVDNQPDGGECHTPEQVFGECHSPLGGSVTRPRGECHSPPSKDKEHIKELSGEVVESYPQAGLFLDVIADLELRDEYLLARPSLQGHIRNQVRLLIEHDALMVSLTDPKVVAVKVLADVLG